MDILSRINFSGASRLPVIQQTEAAECGLACLAMAAEFHGRKIGLAQLRREYSVSLRGATLQSMMQVAHQLKFTTRALRLELEELDGLRAPAILHWNLNHFVVLKKATRKHVVIHDPAVGERRLTWAEVSNHFTGVALELTPAQDFVKRDEQERMALWPLLRGAVGLKRSLAQLLLYSLVLQLFSLLSPLYSQVVIDEAIARHDADLLTLLAIGFFLILIIRMSVSWMRSWLVIYMGNLLALQLKGNLLRHLLRLPLAYFQKRHVGDVMSRFGSMSAIESLLTTGFVQALLDGLLLATTFSVMLVYQPKLTLITVGLLAGYALLRYLRYRPIRDLTQENLIAGAEASSQFMQTLRGMATVKQFGLELDRHAQWQNRFVDVTNTNIRISRISMGFAVVNDLMMGLGGIAILYFGAHLIFEQQFTIGMLMAFSAYMQQFLSAGGSLINMWINFKMLDVHLERLSDIALTEPEEALQAPPASSNLPANLTASGLRFRYAAGESPILDQLDLQIGAGECVAIVGPSGCGKSTLMRILQGLEFPEAGTVEFGGSNIRHLGLSNYRRRVASVTQEDRLLSGSILENLTAFDEKPDNQRAEQWAKACLIHDTIMRMPMNYHSLIGDMGDALSAGERQRLMLARALYREPSVLFLDEATSNLDSELDVRIQQMLAGLKITRVIVTHRPTPLSFADKVFRLGAGKLHRIAAPAVAVIPAQAGI